jgi:hypothetical protein
MKEGTQILTNMFNNIKNIKELSPDWKIAIIHPVLKTKGKRGELGNYRGISLFAFSGKIFSGI